MSDPSQTGHTGKETESDAKRFEVLIAAYLFLAPGRKDYDAVMKLVEEKAITLEGVVLVSKDHAGEMHIEDSSEQVAEGGKTGGAVGVVVGLLEPRWLAKTGVGAHLGALVAKFEKNRVESGIEKKLNETLAEGDALLLAIYDYKDADAVRKAVTNSPKTSFADIDGKSVKDLKAGLAEAQAGMAS